MNIAYVTSDYLQGLAQFKKVGHLAGNLNAYIEALEGLPLEEGVETVFLGQEGVKEDPICLPSFPDSFALWPEQTMGSFVCPLH